MHLRDLQQRPAIFTVWEKKRNAPHVHWLMQCFAEMVSGLITDPFSLDVTQCIAGCVLLHLHRSVTYCISRRMC